MAPILDYGVLILRAFATAIKPKDSEDAGKIYTYIKAIRNKYQSKTGEWKLEEKDLKELKEHIKKCEGALRSPMMIGQLYERIENLELDLLAQKKDSKDDSNKE
jgi:septal ring factor EnvC (AmiA/AmiB activator)